MKNGRENPITKIWIPDTRVFLGAAFAMGYTVSSTKAKVLIGGMDRPALRRHVLQRAILYSSAGRSIRGVGLRNVEKQQRLRRKGSNDPIPSDHLKGRRSAQGPWRGCGENHSIDDPGCERSHRVYPAGLAKNHPGCHGFSGGSIGPLDKDPLVHCSHRRFPVPSSGRIYLWCQYENQYDPAFFAAAS